MKVVDEWFNNLVLWVALIVLYRDQVPVVRETSTLLIVDDDYVLDSSAFKQDRDVLNASTVVVVYSFQEKPAYTQIKALFIARLFVQELHYFPHVKFFTSSEKDYFKVLS